MNTSPQELASLYQQRFSGSQAYRQSVWRVLVNDYFQVYVPETAAVLDLGCGYGEFINQVRCRQKYGMDLNPTTATRLAPDVRLMAQDCAAAWALPDRCLDVIFTSNFLEHLSNKDRVQATLEQAHRCLKPEGRFIALGPNIKFLPGRYWDFWDHHVPLTERALEEALILAGFQVEESIPRFLPYTMSDGLRYPLILLRLYLRLPLVWRWFGRQFLVIARNTASAP